MAYEMQILVTIPKVTPEGIRYIERGFKSVKPSVKFAGPYQFPTAEEAQKMLDSCYPDVPSNEKRVVPIWSGFHHESMVENDTISSLLK